MYCAHTGGTNRTSVIKLPQELKSQSYKHLSRESLVGKMDFRVVFSAFQLCTAITKLAGMLFWIKKIEIYDYKI